MLPLLLVVRIEESKVALPTYAIMDLTSARERNVCDPNRRRPRRDRRRARSLMHGAILRVCSLPRLPVTVGQGMMAALPLETGKAPCRRWSARQPAMRGRAP